MRSFLRKAVASVVSAALVWLAPGLAAHQAFAGALTEVAAGGGANSPSVPLVFPTQPGANSFGARNSSGGLLNGRSQNRFGAKAPAAGDAVPGSLIKEGTPQAGPSDAVGAALENVQDAVQDVNETLAKPDSEPGKAEEKSRKIFENGAVEPGSDFVALTRPSADLSQRERGSIRAGNGISFSRSREKVAPLLRRGMRDRGNPYSASKSPSILSFLTDHANALLLTGSLGVIAVSLVTLHLTPALVALPAIALTCSSMRERAIKDATILPRETNRDTQKKAQKELDDVLIAFGKRVKELAAGDPSVQSAVSSFKAEHAAENPLLDLLPQWKERLEKGEDLTNEAAWAELRAAVLAELKKTTLTSESAEKIEELFRKAGFEESFKAWEAKYKILEALRENGKQVRKEKEKRIEIPKSSGNQHGFVTVQALLLTLAASLVSLLAVIQSIALRAGNFVAPPAEPPVALDAFLASAGLNAKEIEFLKQFTMDMGAKETAPVIGRTEELKKVITILSKPAGTQNNPMMLGDKGVGKTAIVEAVAQRLYLNRLPSLKGKRILELDIGAMTAGTSLQGEMEKRLTTLKQILAKTNNRVILFVDEIHSILKNASTSNAVPDLLKAPLRNGEMTVIGATTLGEYRKYMESDPAFADRFSPVMVNEPTVDEAIEMLLGDQDYLEKKFGVVIAPGTIEAAVRLSARYIPEKFLPRKARVDVLEKALAQSKPEAARDGVQVQIEQMTERLRVLVRQFALLKQANAEGPEAKAQEVETYNRIVATYQTIASLEEKQKSIQARTVTKQDVIRVIAEETGVPVGDLAENEYKKLEGMEPWFKQRIVGQDEAVSAIAETVRANKANLNDPNHPVGSFLFAGKTGVGKTELARTLADFLFSDKDAVIRLDMSEYMEKFSVQRLFGAPPGYVGYDQGGELTEKVRRKPYSVIVFDEIEKAHPDVLNALLQVLDAGRMTDGKGNTVNFKNTIIIMTSNIGAESSAQGEEFKKEVDAAIRERLRPEFVNRIDKLIVFNPLTMGQAESIVKILVKDVAKRLRDQELQLEVTPEAVAQIAMEGFDPRYGARPLKRMVELKITQALSRFILSAKVDGRLVNGGVITASAKDGQIAFELRPNPPPVVELSPLPPGPLGEKLRRILEEAVKPGANLTGDLATFESVLFPERAAVVFTAPMGAFKPAASPGEKNPTNYGKSLAADGGPDLKDPQLESVKSAIRSEFDARWSAASAEAADAWADAFARLAKRFSGRPAEGRAAVIFEYGVPVVQADAILRIQLAAPDYAQEQQLLRLLKDHFSETPADDDAVRALAARLKDEGREADRDLLELKRRIESVPGLTFGFQKTSSGMEFWFKAPVAGKTPKAPAPGTTKPAAPVQAPAASADNERLLAKISVFRSDNPKRLFPGALVWVPEDSGYDPQALLTDPAVNRRYWEISGAKYHNGMEAKDARAAAEWALRLAARPEVAALKVSDEVMEVLRQPAEIFTPDAAPPDERASQLYSVNISAGSKAPANVLEYMARVMRDMSAPGTSLELVQYAFQAFLAQMEGLSPQNPWLLMSRTQPRGGLLLEVGVDYEPTDKAKALLETLERQLSVNADDEEDVKGWAAQLTREGVKIDARLIDLKRRLRAIPGARIGYMRTTTKRDGVTRADFWVFLPESAVVTRTAPSPNAAPSEGPMTTLDARSSPSKLLLFLTQGYPSALQPLRRLAADLLAADSSATRLVGLHVASGLLPPEGFAELAAATRLMRLSTPKDFALLAELLRENPAVALPTQREALAEAFDAQWKAAMRALRPNTGYGDGSDLNTLALFADLYARTGPTTERDALARLKDLDRAAAGPKRVFWRNMAGSAAAVAAAAGAVWKLGFHFGGWQIGVGVALAAALITTWSLYNNRYDRYSSNARQSPDPMRTALLPLLGEADRAELLARLLDARSSGGMGYDAFARKATALVGAAPAKGALEKAFRDWRADLQKDFAKERKNSANFDRERVDSLSLLGHLYPLVPESERAALTKMMLEPLRRRWVWRGIGAYAKALAAWLRAAPLADNEADEITGLLGRWTQGSGFRDSGESIADVLDALASRPLSSAARIAVEDMARAVAAETSDQTVWIRLQLVRARSGYGADAWKALRQRLAGSPRSLEYSVGAVAGLLQVSEPPAEEAAWLRGMLQTMRDSDEETTRDAADLLQGALTRSTPISPAGQTDRLSYLLRRLQRLDIPAANGPGKNVSEDYVEHLEELRALVKALVAQERKAGDGALDRSVKDALARLSQQD